VGVKPSRCLNCLGQSADRLLLTHSMLFMLVSGMRLVVPRCRYGASHIKLQGWANTPRSRPLAQLAVSRRPVWWPADSSPRSLMGRSLERHAINFGYQH
jgi:hypothetical protein